MKRSAILPYISVFNMDVADLFFIFF